MGRRDRERKQRIESGEEEPYRNLSGIQQKLIIKAENMARKVINKTLVPAWKKMSLEQQIKVARGVLRARGLIDFRADFLNSFPEDLQDMHNEGKTKEEIRSYYMENETFHSFWADLQLNEDHFEALLNEL